MADDPLLNQPLGDYQPTQVLGRGGMGVVYAADDLALSRRVALKVLKEDLAEDMKARERFQQEINHAVAIEHPNVVPVYAAGYERPHFFIAMRLIDGPDLNAVIRDHGPLEEGRALRILGQVASALSTVHAQKLVHRDVKPHNVLLWASGTEDEHAMLTDFGIAKAVDDTRGLTGIGTVGTPGYMAPEVCLNRGASAASDQYSLACMAFEMLSGRLPFDATGSDLLRAHAEDEPHEVQELVPHISAPVASAIARALKKDPRERFPDVRGMVRAMKEAEKAFARSETLTQIMTRTNEPELVVGEMAATGLSDDRISHVTGLNATEVARVRRRNARKALVGRR